MAYESVAITAGSGTNIAVDTVGAQQIQVVKLDVGADGASTPVVGALPVSDNGGNLSIDDGGNVISVDDGAASLTVDAPVATPVFVRLSDGAAAISALPVTDNASSLTVDAPVGTPVFTRLSDGSAALVGQKTGANSLPVVLSSDTGLPTGANTIGTVNGPTLTKGTQGTVGFSVQNLKDAGRTPWSAFAEAVAGSTSDALITLSFSTGAGVTVTTGTMYTVPAGKTLRITHIALTFIATTTTANTSKVRLRGLASGTLLVTSPIFLSLPRLGFETATFIANESAAPVIIALPDGLEFAAANAVGLTHIEAAANGTLDVQLFGFLY